MLALYSAVALLSTSGLTAALTLWSLDTVHWAAWLLLVSGVSCMLAAGVVLIQESRVSLSIVEAHAQEIQSKAS